MGRTSSKTIDKTPLLVYDAVWDLQVLDGHGHVFINRDEHEELYRTIYEGSRSAAVQANDGRLLLRSTLREKLNGKRLLLNHDGHRKHTPKFLRHKAFSVVKQRAAFRPRKFQTSPVLQVRTTKWSSKKKRSHRVLLRDFLFKDFGRVDSCWVRRPCRLA